MPVTEESAWDAPPNYVEPVMTFYTVPDDTTFADPDCAEGGQYYLCWPTIAPSSVEVYEEGAIGGLASTLLVTTLKRGDLYGIRLGANGPKVDEPVLLFHTVDRYRDTAISAKGDRIWLATDSAGSALGDDGHPTDVLANPGAILELTAGEGTDTGTGGTTGE